MLRRILLRASALIAVVVVIAFGLHRFAGLNVVFMGGGIPSLTFQPVVGAEEQAERIAQHRAAQRAPTSGSAVVSTHGANATLPALGDAAPQTQAAPPAVRIATGTYWTDFRGPLRDGHYQERPIRTDWPDSGLTPLWKQPSGGGYASFVAADGLAFTIEQRGPQEVVAAYDIATGRERWTTAWPAVFKEFQGGDGPRATPTWSDGRLYALGALGEFRCLDAATGRTLWRTNILEDANVSNLHWGMAASPLVVDDVVITAPGGIAKQSVVAYDQLTGQRRWTALNDTAGYSSPMAVELAGVPHLLVFTASRLAALTPDGSQLLWEYPWTTSFDVNASQPLMLGGDRIFLSSGYGTGAAVIRVAHSDGRLVVRELWRNTRMKNKFTSSVVQNGYIYGLDAGILACVDAATGELQWKGGRYGFGQVVLASEHLIVLTEDGDLALVKATPSAHIEVSRSPALTGKSWNHPAIVDGILLVRSVSEMAAFDLRTITVP